MGLFKADNVFCSETIMKFIQGKQIVFPLLVKTKNCHLVHWIWLLQSLCLNLHLQHLACIIYFAGNI
jgi:hypothetical protein